MNTQELNVLLIKLAAEKQAGGMPANQLQYIHKEIIDLKLQILSLKKKLIILEAENCELKKDTCMVMAMGVEV